MSVKFCPSSNVQQTTWGCFRPSW